MIDFSNKAYQKLLEFLVNSDWSVTTQEKYIGSEKKIVILRHDIDRNPLNALEFAKMEQRLGISSTYYFRTISKTLKPEIIKQICALGHEIGYHYENLSDYNGDFKKAFVDFESKLEIMRNFYPVKTICSHGSPMSKWNNKEIWEKYNYQDYDIICETYYDLDFNQIFYITDAGRSWNNESVSIRDKVESKFNILINSIDDIIKVLKSQKAPDQIIISIHPHNWAKSKLEWFKIWTWQNLKNIIKRMIIIGTN